MKKQEVLICIIALIMMISCAALSFSQELTLDKYNLKQYQNQYKKIIDIGFMGKDIKSFGSALENGNLKAVKYLTETYPGLNLLNTPIKNEDGEKEQPICIAAGKGYTELVTYMVGQDSNLVNKDCFDNNKDFKAIGKALDNGFADTALALLELNSPVTTEWRWNHFSKWTGFRPVLFVIVAQTFKDRETLEKLIPALLNAGTPVDELAGSSGNYWDAFDSAANNENINFIEVLRDEMIKRGQTPISNIEIYATCDKDLEERISWHEESKEFLQSYGVIQYCTDYSADIMKADMKSK